MTQGKNQVFPPRHEEIMRRHVAPREPGAELGIEVGRPILAQSARPMPDSDTLGYVSTETLFDFQ